MNSGMSPRAVWVVVQRLAVALTIGAIAWIAFRPIFAVDMFWLLALGREIWQRGALPMTDLFSAVHPERPWVQFQWLWELGAYLVSDHAGIRGLRVVNATALGAGFGLFYVGVRRQGLSRAWSLLLTVVGALLFVDRFRLRPDALNFALLSGLFPVLAGGYRSLKGPGRVAVGAYCFLWSSLHGGGVLLPIASAGALWVGAGVATWRGRGTDGDARAAGWLLVCCAVGAGLSPASLPGLVHFFSVYGDMSAGSPEWSPTWSVLSERRHLLNYLVVACPWLAGLAYGAMLRRLHRRGQRIDLGEVLWVAGCLLLSMLVLRMVFLAIVPCTLAARAALQGQRSRRPEPAAALVPWALAAGLLGLLVDYSLVGPRGSLEKAVWFATTFDLEPTAFPEEAVSFVAQAKLRGNTLAGRTAGGMLLYYAYPNVHVLADSRHNFTPDIWSLVRAVEQPDQQWEALGTGWARFGLELALLEGPFVRVASPPAGWQLLLRAGTTEVYQHLQGKNAEHNLRAARSFLRARGSSIPRDAEGQALARAATEVGARMYLSHAFRRHTLARIADLERGADPARAAIAIRSAARLALETGDDAGAAAALGRLPKDVADPRALLYRAVLADRKGDPEAARGHMRALAPFAATLPRDEALTAMLLARKLEL